MKGHKWQQDLALGQGAGRLDGDQSGVGTQGEYQLDKRVTHGAVPGPWQGLNLLQREEQQLGTDIENISSRVLSPQ